MRKVTVRSLAAFGLALAAVAAPAQTQTTPAAPAETQIAPAAPAPSAELIEQGRLAFTAAVCSVCHSVVQGAPNGIGPNLFGVVGRDIASVPGFNYSAALAAFMPGQAWTPELLDRWIAGPTTLVPGTTMVLGAADPAQRAAIIAYLGTLVAPPPPPAP